MPPAAVSFLFHPISPHITEISLNNGVNTAKMGLGNQPGGIFPSWGVLPQDKGRRPLDEVAYHDFAQAVAIKEKTKIIKKRRKS